MIFNTALWCNGNTEASGALVLGSNPSRATKEQTMVNKPYKTKRNQENHKTMLLVIYVFILLVTTSHHHPTNFANTSVILNSAPTEESGHSFTSKDCPIIIFSQNGFNSTFALNTSIEISFKKHPLVKYEEKTPIEKRAFSSFSRRGPPSFII